MQIFEFELIELIVTTPAAATAPIPAPARAAGSDRLLEHAGLTLARHLNRAVLVATNVSREYGTSRDVKGRDYAPAA